MKILNAKVIKHIYVQTPKGKVVHGQLLQYKNGIIFYRKIESKDVMKNFNAFSIHPDALDELNKKNVLGLVYEYDKEYKLSLKNLNKMLSGELKDEGKKMAWANDTFKGGDTLYIKIEAFNKDY